MKCKNFSVIFLFLVLLINGCIIEKPGEEIIKKKVPEVKSTIINNVSIEWLGHASFKVSDDVIIYIDPYILPEGAEKADLILVTHEHFDHCDPNRINQIRKDDTVIVTTSACANKLKDVITVKSGDKLNVRGVPIEVVPAYNVEKPYHPKGRGVGFVFEIHGLRIYHAGDTDFIPEMKNLREIDVALLPIGGTYTMDEEEASEAVKAINPKIVIPMHYNYIENTEADPIKFKSLASEKDPRVEVRIL